MKRITSIGIFILGWYSAALVGAATPQSLLPPDTLAVFTVPDWGRAKSEFEATAMAKLYRDPAMKPFFDGLKSGFRRDVLTPLERELGLELEEMAGLVEGQWTAAVIRNEWDGTSTGKLPGFLILMDSGSKSERTTALVEKLKEKWLESGRHLRRETIRGVEFSIIPGEEMQAAIGWNNAGEGSEDTAAADGAAFPELFLGQSQSLLLLGTAAKNLEEVLVRQGGGNIPSLAEDPQYRADFESHLRRQSLYGWIHVNRVRQIFSTMLGEGSSESGGPNPQNVMEALGLNGWKSLLMGMEFLPRGTQATLFLGVPESERKGLFQLLAFQEGNAQVPSFVPSDFLSFSRWRFDARKAWQSLETMLTEISPQFAFLFQTMVSSFGKEQNPNFDLKTSIVQNLGNDFISMTELVGEESGDWEQVLSPPQLMLVGSPNPDQLLGGIRTIASMLAGAMGGLQERVVNGRTIYSFPMPTPEQQAIEFSANAEYFILATHPSLMNQYLGQGGDNLERLREWPALAESAAAVGGMNTGLFGVENDRLTMRQFIEAIKTNPDFLKNLPENIPNMEEEISDVLEKLDGWMDFQSLPATEQISRYFSYTVYAGKSTPRGIEIQSLSPTPPNLP